MRHTSLPVTDNGPFTSDTTFALAALAFGASRWTDDTTPRTDKPVRFLCPTCGLPQHKGPRDESGRRLSGCAIRHTA